MRYKIVCIEKTVDFSTQELLYEASPKTGKTRVQFLATSTGEYFYKYSAVGVKLVSIDGLVDEWTTRKAMDVIQAKSVNAEKANTLGTVKVSMGRDFRFGTRSAEAVAA
jgi:hypothetical protein